MSMQSSTQRGAAEELAHALLAPLGNRWRHTAGVAARAAELAPLLDVNGKVLGAAAWLHDIGYADATTVTGFHPSTARGTSRSSPGPRRLSVWWLTTPGPDSSRPPAG